MTKQDLPVTSDLRLTLSSGPPSESVRPPAAQSGVVDTAPVVERVDDLAPAGSLSAADLWATPMPAYTYLGGPAGSGKTFLTRAWAETDPSVLLCATTGIAAINLGGSTINSQIGYFDTKSLQDMHVIGYLSARLGKLYKIGIRRIILDEASMLDGDQLTLLVQGIEELSGRGYTMLKDEGEGDEHTKAMGLTLVGDFAQLRPINAPFAFESSEWRRTPENQADRFAEATHLLSDIRRQSDPAFVQALRAARVGDGRTVAEYISAHGGFQPTSDDRFEGPTILAKNEAVDKYNWLRLDKVQGANLIFPSERWGEQRNEWGNPKKPPNTWGIPLRLNLKVGALVMILANRRAEGPPPQPYLYVNGELGTLVDANVEEHVAYVKLQRTGAVEPVDYVRREVKIPCDGARRRELRDLGKEQLISEDGRWEITGWIDYLPVRLAYASTVHKSQGLSLDRVQVNIRDGFFKEPGMVYVALSRARTSAGLRLVGTPASLIERCTVNPKLKAWL